MNRRLPRTNLPAIQRIEGVAGIRLLQEHAAQARLAGIQIQQQHAHSQPGQRERQMRGDGRLALSRPGGCDRHAAIPSLAELPLEHVRNRNELVPDDGIAPLPVRAGDQPALPAEIAPSLQDLAQQLQPQLALDVPRVQQRGPDQQLQYRQRDAHHHAERRHAQPTAEVQAAAEDVAGSGLVDHGHAADLQGSAEDVRQQLVDGRQYGDSLLGASPVQLQLHDLRRIVLT